MSEPDDVLPDTTSDERAVGWGDEYDEDSDARDEERLRAERPPHHDR